MKKFILIGLLAVANPALATPAATGGFTAGDLATAAQSLPNADLQQARILMEETESLRLAIAYDAGAGVGIRGPIEQILLADALGMSDAATDLRAKWFMAGAIAQTPIGTNTMLYNPLARGTLVLGWSKSPEGNWQVASANLLSNPPSQWQQEAEKPYLAALVADYATNIATIGTQSGGYAAMEANRYIAGMAVWLRDPSHRQVTTEVREIIVAGRAANYGANAIDMMPTNARATYWPIATFERSEGGHSLIYGSALYPQILIAADFDASARPKLARLTLVNLGNAGAAQ
ncbi:MAG: hypothetical protein FD163_1765 [Hyphomonadaceae bacterium]|nr:MAG: hypothetical protein FD128_1188 [Hyphomonadaceae bacterium]KAF0185068.1 MAG: hypothetical protein FD163_1765 [Hyphomonadaceae bacterium]